MSDVSSPPASPSPLVAALLEDLGLSPTPYHAVARASALLLDAGFRLVDGNEAFPGGSGGRVLVDGGSLIAWIQTASADGYLAVGAHTDSPNLRVRTHPDVGSGGFSQVGVEIYGGVLLNSWLDRDLGLAGRVAVRASSGQIRLRLLNEAGPILRIPQLAIHLDREIRDKGLKLDPQKHLTPLWAVGDGTEGELANHVASILEIAVDQILAWDLMMFDTQPPAVVGRDSDFIASARIDNLVSAFCGLRALMDINTDVEAGALAPVRTPVLVLYDHEEIGSETATGAGGPNLGITLERIAAARGVDRAGYLASLGRSLVVSADGAHATHPNYVDKHEPSHQIALNGGVVIKRNANQRYATDAQSEAFVAATAAIAGVPLQYYIHRNDLPCGSTIGPITAARLGVSTVDLGAPQLAMHSARETAGVADLDHLQQLLTAVWSSQDRLVSAADR